MELSDYTKILEANAILVEYEGKKHYINGKMNGDVINVMSNPDIAVQDKQFQMLACVICNESGVRLFNVNNEDHVNIVRSFPVDLQTALILKVQENFYPDKKKALKVQA